MSHDAVDVKQSRIGAARLLQTVEHFLLLKFVKIYLSKLLILVGSNRKLVENGDNLELYAFTMDTYR